MCFYHYPLGLRLWAVFVYPVYFEGTVFGASSSRLIYIILSLKKKKSSFFLLFLILDLMYHDCLEENQIILIGSCGFLVAFMCHKDFDFYVSSSL